MAKVEGYRDGLATLVITEQKGRAFKGHLVRSNKDGDVKEDLWGAFTPGGQLMVGSDDEGYYWFTLVNNNTLDYCYAEAGAGARTTCARLTRKSSGNRTGLYPARPREAEPRIRCADFPPSRE